VRSQQTLTEVGWLAADAVVAAAGEGVAADVEAEKATVS